MEELELIIFIIRRGGGDKLIKLANERNISFSLLLHGRGTISSEILNMLGIDGPEKDVVILSSDRPRAEEVMNGLAEAMELNEPGGGISFMIPFSAVASQFMSYELLAGSIEFKSKRKDRKRMNRPGSSSEDRK